MSSPRRFPKGDYSASLRKHYLSLVKTRKEIQSQLQRLKPLKARYEQAVERFFNELEKNPSRYTHHVKRGNKMVSKPLTVADVRRHRQAFRKQMATKGILGFFFDWDDCDCPERSWCVRLNCDPAVFNSCCYLCLSTDPIQCLGDFP